MGLIEWIKKFKKDFDILMIGLDNSGKTSIINFLRTKDALDTVPTVGVQEHEFRLADTVVFKLLDTAGQKQYRGNWSKFLRTTDVIIFVVDVMDEARYPEAREEFEKVVQSLRERRNGNKVPILMAMNKIDLLKSKEEIDKKAIELLKYFKFEDFLEKKNPYHIQPTCALTGDGLFDLIKWIFTETTGKRIDSKITFEEFMVFEKGGNLLISKSQFFGKDMDQIIGSLMHIINSCVSQLNNKNHFAMELDNKRILVYNIDNLTGVAVIDSADDDTRASTLLQKIIKNLSSLNFSILDEESKKKYYNQMVIEQLDQENPSKP